MHSLWEETVTPERFPSLNQNVNTDVLIIGGGLCGLLCAHRLHQEGIDYVLVEARRVCSGITKNTTAKITSQHGLIYHKLIRTVGIEKARQYLRANEAALKQYAQLCQDMDCDFEYRDAYVYSLDNAQKIRQEIEAYKTLGIQPSFCDTLPLPFPVAGAVRLEGQAQFNPLKFAGALSSGLHIYENTQVLELIGRKAVTPNGTIQAKKILVTTHFPFLNKHGLYFLKLYQHRSYVIALKNAPQLEGMYVDEAQKGMSFRNYKDMLLVGGGDHRTGKNGGNWRELREFAKRYYPQATECGHWATQDCMSLDSIPYIGPYSANTEGLYVATGFHKWGMTSSMASAMLLSDFVQGKENPWSPVFSPSRSILHPQLAVNAGESMLNLLTPSTKRCPHLGCALKWNPLERTWDCPCHGSRFTEDGRLIDNPATGDLNGINPVE